MFLLLFTVVLDFYFAKIIDQSQSLKARKALVVSSVLINLGVLGLFKYYNFFAETTNGLAFTLMGQLGIESRGVLPELNLILPIAISFYTFQSMSYVIDVYRRVCRAHGSLLEFSSYVTLFPHQISGPLVRHNVIVPQLESNKTYIFNPDNFWRGICFFVLGLSKKLLIADRLAVVIDPLVSNISIMSNAEAILCMIGYTLQLYFDFSGYSDMAVGLGLLMNIQFPQNFNSPYKSHSITEFWQRWHITLSSWLRDYLYISMGGNRLGVLKTYRNLFLTMLIGGFWHGANWTFVIWGAYHGVLLVIERLLGLDKFSTSKGVWGYLKKWSRLLIVFILVNIGWVFFRAHDFSSAVLWLEKIFLLDGSYNFSVGHIPAKHGGRFLLALLIGLPVVMISKNTWQLNLKPSYKLAIILAFLFMLCLSFMGEESPFLYFQF